jgi:hypothetical protein
MQPPRCSTALTGRTELEVADKDLADMCHELWEQARGPTEKDFRHTFSPPAEIIARYFYHWDKIPSVMSGTLVF